MTVDKGGIQFLLRVLALVVVVIGLLAALHTVAGPDLWVCLFLGLALWFAGSI